MSEMSGGRDGAHARRFGSLFSGWWLKLRASFGPRNGESHLRDAIEEIIVEAEDQAAEQDDRAPIGSHEKLLLANLLKLRHVTAYDVMVPRADIVAIDIATGLDEVLDTLIGGGHSRLPVYRKDLDNIAGLVHIKDVLPFTRKSGDFDLAQVLRDISVVAPSIRALDLLLDMRLTRQHLAVVVDEFGGIDGLVTIEDLIEQIVGEIEDEHDVDEGPKLIDESNGSIVADARIEIEEFEARCGTVLSQEERDEDIDTLGGLVFFLAERVPTRGELIHHPNSGMTFEVLEADPRRVKRLRLRDVPQALDTAAKHGQE